MIEQLINDLVEVTLNIPDDFLKIRETLTRIGVAPRNKNELYQSCHILHKQKRYFIVHFKELLGLDGKPTNFSDDDRRRRNTIADLLSEWKLIKLVKPISNEDKCPISFIKIIPFKEKDKWQLNVKYNIGHKKTSLDMANNMTNNMTNFDMVRKFMNAYNQEVQTIASIPSDSIVDLRYNLITEELDELNDAITDANLVDIADALTDILYVVYGAGHAFGINLNKCFSEVHRSNMSKLGLDGKPIYREDGKVLKGPNYTPPNLTNALDI